MSTFIQTLIKEHQNVNLTKVQYDILEKIRINYETSPRYDDNDGFKTTFGIVIKFKNLIKYAKENKDKCPWIYDISLGSQEEIDDPVFWSVERWSVDYFYISLICCSNYIVIELDNDRIYDFYKLAKDISRFLKTEIPENGSSKYNIGKKDFIFNICFPEKICKC